MAALYFARLAVVPERAHPLFWKVDSANLELYFFADSEDDAIERAEAFPAVARWQLQHIQELGCVKVPASDSHSKPEPTMLDALETGLAWRTIAVRTGGDETTHPQ